MQKVTRAHRPHIARFLYTTALVQANSFHFLVSIAFLSLFLFGALPLLVCSVLLLYGRAGNAIHFSLRLWSTHTAPLRPFAFLCWREKWFVATSMAATAPVKCLSLKYFPINFNWRWKNSRRCQETVHCSRTHTHTTNKRSRYYHRHILFLRDNHFSLSHPPKIIFCFLYPFSIYPVLGVCIVVVRKSPEEAKHKEKHRKKWSFNWN